MESAVRRERLTWIALQLSLAEVAVVTFPCHPCQPRKQLHPAKKWKGGEGGIDMPIRPGCLPILEVTPKEVNTFVKFTLSLIIK